LASNEFTSSENVDGEPSSFQQQLDALRAELYQWRESSTKPKYPTLEIHGVFQADSAWIHQTDANIDAIKEIQIDSGVPATIATGNIRDGASFRRARLQANGAVTPNMNYFLQMDFAFFGRPTFTDLWMELTQVPVLGNVRVGNGSNPSHWKWSAAFATRRLRSGP
jgi:phosphate-selective porin OprO/OprP